MVLYHTDVHLTGSFSVFWLNKSCLDWQRQCFNLDSKIPIFFVILFFHNSLWFVVILIVSMAVCTVLMPSFCLRFTDYMVYHFIFAQFPVYDCCHPVILSYVFFWSIHLLITSSLGIGFFFLCWSKRWHPLPWWTQVQFLPKGANVP